MTYTSAAETISQLAKQGHNSVVEYRHHLHRFPEVSEAEEQTAAYISSRLDVLGIDHTSGIAGHGICGLIDTGIEGPTVLLRADMDALPVTEQADLPYKSQNDGVMHACGHDCHMAMLLGVADVLNTMAQDAAAYGLQGKIKLVFQPAEEYPGGAKPMIDAGVMDNPHVDYCLGAHVWPEQPEGKVSVTTGPMMAAMDRFDITIKGKGGHAAKPHHCVDALEIGTQVIAAMQRIISRKVDPLKPALLTVGEFKAGSAFNVIPGEAYLCGTLRTFDADIRAQWQPLIRQVVEGVCASMGATADILFRSGYPAVVNDAEVADIVRQAATAVLGEDAILHDQSMGGEDMAYFLERAPGCFYFIGSGFDGCAPSHNPHFQVHDHILQHGVEIMCRAAVVLLQHTK
ncbi:M20 metallopeptidase family protein [Oleidesulfovibrio sp.]|uniref:M20 metallopeptidase family protein n=1 Tax=Oleidesulfovibrio sp. TaxID=2909707 RepID=UPI003A8C2BA0